MVKLLGYADVDAGLLMIGDPCYQFDEHEDWIKFLNEYSLLSGADTAEVKHEQGYKGKGVVCSTSFGDGSFPVYRIGTGSMAVITELETEEAVKGLRELANMLEREAHEEEDDEYDANEEE